MLIRKKTVIKLKEEAFILGVNIGKCDLVSRYKKLLKEKNFIEEYKLAFSHLLTFCENDMPKEMLLEAFLGASELQNKFIHETIQFLEKESICQ